MTKKKVVRIFFRELKGTFKDFFLKIYFQKNFLPPNICDPNFCPPNIYDKSTPLNIRAAVRILCSNESLVQADSESLEELLKMHPPSELPPSNSLVFQTTEGDVI